MVGGVPVGGGAPVSIQSMTTVPPADIKNSIRQLETLASAGCDIVRLAVPDLESAHAIAELRPTVHKLPLVADIHFDYRLAIAAVNAGADKIRINPGNIGGSDKVRAVVSACRERGVPIRVGVNGGSLERELLERYGGVTPEALAESAMGHVRLLEDEGFFNICISAKASEVMTTVQAYRLLSKMSDYPLHLGITEAGTEFVGTIRSAAGIGTLLCEGIGDTIRVSLTAAPEREVTVAAELLRSLGLRKRGARLISCPTCGRCGYDMLRVAGEVEKRLQTLPPERELTVAVMGCAVNGPGEARAADFGIAGGKGDGVLFRKGEIVGRAPQEKLVDALFDLIENG